MRKLGKKELILDLAEPMQSLPPSLGGNLYTRRGGNQLVYTYDSHDELRAGIGGLLNGSASSASASRTSRPRELARGYLREPGPRNGHESRGRQIDLSL